MATHGCLSWRCSNVLMTVLLYSVHSVFVVPSASARDDVPADPDRIRNEAPKAWLSYLHALADYQVDTQVTSRDGTGKVTDRQTNRFVGAYPRCVVEINTGTKHEVVQGYNKEYRFEISKSSGGQWVVEELSPVRNTVPIEELSFPDYGQGGPGHTAGQETAIAMTKGLLVTIVDSLPMLFTKKEFRIAEAQEVTDVNLRLVRIAYSFEPDRFTPNQLARSGEVFLMPDHYWLIKRAKVYAAEPPDSRVTIEISNEYDMLSTELPLLTKQKMSLNGGGYNNDSIEATCSGVAKVTDVDPKRFTLSAYGLPEPVFSEPERSRMWLFYATLTLLVVCIVLSVYRQYRRTQRT